MTAFEYIVNGLPDEFACDEYAELCEIAGNMPNCRENRSVKLLNELFLNDHSYYDKSGNTVYVIEKECLKKLKSIEVTFDEGTEAYNTYVRRPYYQLRGKPVSEEQAAEFIQRTDFAFRDCDYSEEKPYFYLINMDSDLFSDSGSNGMVHPSGVVGMNGIMGKYPNFCELFSEFVGLAMEFPFLDFVLAVSDWNEIAPEEWDEICTDGYERPSSYPNFTKNLEIGVWVHEGKVEFLSPDNASKKYKEYEKLYGEKDAEIYCNKPYGDPELAGFFVECLEANGVGGEKFEKRLDKFRKDIMRSTHNK